VISGEVAGVDRAVELAPERGAKRAMKLNVSGAFHSALMADARAELEAFLAGIPFADAKVPVIANVTASPVTRAAEIRTLLGEQMTSPVRWEESMRTLVAEGCEFVEVGAGSVLKGLLRQVDKSAVCTAVGTAESIDALRAAAPGGVS
jgi:[acyl-carrier-protein] S-malonyltransferase